MLLSVQKLLPTGANAMPLREDEIVDVVLDVGRYVQKENKGKKTRGTTRGVGRRRKCKRY